MWNCIAKDLNTVTQITFSRQYLSNPTESEKRRLHIFVDASMASYGAAAFICDKEESRLLMAKNRVAPRKTLTLPKLELMAALNGARLADHLQSTFPATNVTMWSDSQIVLHWIATQKVLPKFVANRVKEIRDLTGQYKWKYCPTKDNPADLLTRGITANNFMKNDLWMTGPDWLCDRNRWPMWEFSENQVQILLEEPGCTQMLITDQTARSSPEGNIQNVLSVQKYSRLNKLLRVTGYVLRFIKNCKAGRANVNLDPLFASELQLAQLLWIRGCQATYYREELQELKTSKPRASLIRQLRLFLDPTGAIRCGGRIHNAALDDVTKFPYLLPNKHILTMLMIQAAHELHGHSGLNSTVTNIRQKFWIPAMRQCVNAVIRKCVICRKVQGNPYKSPEVPPLPKLRVKEAPAFTVTGVDFTGALYIKNPTGTEAKAYVCLFTCAVTRALHLEVVTSMSADYFLQAFRRFANRKSLPSLMVSDNAKTFQKASTYLKSMFESLRVRDHLTNAGVDWQFIPERAPWYGGWWERLIGITKRTLKKILGRALVDLETLQTVVTEVESILNDRPLTYVSSSLEDPEP